MGCAAVRLLGLPAGACRADPVVVFGHVQNWCHQAALVCLPQTVGTCRIQVGPRISGIRSL